MRAQVPMPRACIDKQVAAGKLQPPAAETFFFGKKFKEGKPFSLFGCQSILRRNIPETMSQSFSPRPAPPAHLRGCRPAA